MKITERAADAAAAAGLEHIDSAQDLDVYEKKFGKEERLKLEQSKKYLNPNTGKSAHNILKEYVKNTLVVKGEGEKNVAK